MTANKKLNHFFNIKLLGKKTPIITMDGNPFHKPTVEWIYEYEGKRYKESGYGYGFEEIE